MSDNDTAADLGGRVRELRRERGLTLKELGSRADLSHPFLSQLERGLARPSVGSVERIARALGVPVTALWTARRSVPARLARAGDGTLVPHAEAGAPGGVRELPDDESALRVREWSGGSRTWPRTKATAVGEILLYVARGALDIDLDGTVHALDEGDALRFDGGVPHRIRRRGGVATRALLVAQG
jgi:transcriptional regulator with XRE-family HTH domain